MLYWGFIILLMARRGQLLGTIGRWLNETGRWKVTPLWPRLVAPLAAPLPGKKAERAPFPEQMPASSPRSRRRLGLCFPLRVLCCCLCSSGLCESPSDTDLVARSNQAKFLLLQLRIALSALTCTPQRPAGVLAVSCSASLSDLYSGTLPCQLGRIRLSFGAMEKVWLEGTSRLMFSPFPALALGTNLCVPLLG